MRLALIPLGGSLVNLIPAYSTGTGNALEGDDVNQSLYSSFVSESTYYSYIYSRVPNQLTAKWQFYRQTQYPFRLPDLINSWAFSPWPYPSDKIFSLDSNISFYLARSKRYCIGSDPEDRTKIIGIILVESLKADSKLKTGDSINLRPRKLSIKIRIPFNYFSFLNYLTKSNF